MNKTGVVVGRLASYEILELLTHYDGGDKPLKKKLLRLMLLADDVEEKLHDGLGLVISKPLEYHSCKESAKSEVTE